MAKRDIDQDLELAKSICEIAKINTKLQHLFQISTQQGTLSTLPFALQDAEVILEAFDDERLADIFLDAIESVEEELEGDDCKVKVETVQGAKGIAKQPRRVGVAVKELVVDESNVALMLAGQKFRMWLQGRYPLTWERILWDV